MKFNNLISICSDYQEDGTIIHLFIVSTEDYKYKDLINIAKNKEEVEIEEYNVTGNIVHLELYADDTIAVMIKEETK